MAAAFPGPYTDLSLTQRPPFSQVSQAVDVKNPRDLGLNRSYQEDLTQTLRTEDYSAQQADPKPFPRSRNQVVGYDPYAIGGGVESYLDNANG
jgi:hypothetical protein